MTLYHRRYSFYPPSQSAFFDPILPIDVKFNLADRKDDDTEPFDRETFEEVLASATTIRGKIHESASNE